MNKVGLMLGGGGAKGTYQLGVIKSLIERGFYSNVSVISGTSIGAINAFLLGSVPTFDEMFEIWKLIKNHNVFKNLRSDHQGLFDLNDLKQTILEKVDLNYLRNYSKDIFVTTSKMAQNTILSQINLQKISREVFHLNYCDDPIDATMASGSIPLVFGAKQIGDNFYVDGGLVDQNPYEPLINMGCDIIFSVPLGKKVKPWFNYKKQNILDIDFLIPNYFRFSTVGDLTQSINFTPQFKTKIFWLGYYYSNTLIDKIINENIVFFNDNNLETKNSSYRRVCLDKKEIMEVKNKVKERLSKKDDPGT
jgi:NTE family protein